MAGDEVGYRWWIRFVLIPLIGGGGLLGLWLALKPSPPRNIPTDPAGASQPAVIPSEPDQRAHVENVVAQWLNAWLAGDADAFVSLASEPFYFDQRIMLTRPALRVAYDSLKMQKGDSWQKVEVSRIKVMTARELQATGFDLSKDRVFGNMNLNLDDYAVEVSFRFEGREEGMLVVVRRGPPLQVVGTWD